MKGAREYYGLFKTGQYGRFYIVVGCHARGTTFRIQLLPINEVAISNGENNLCLNKAAIEIYGIVSGNPGWTETYGWKYSGKWIEDFNKLVELMQARKKEETDIFKNEINKAQETENTRITKILEEY